MANEELKSTPEGASVIMALADLYSQNGMYEQAIDLAKSAIEKDPKTIEAYIILAKVYKAQGDIKKAQEFAAKGLEIDSENQELKGYIPVSEERVIKEEEEQKGPEKATLSTEEKTEEVKEEAPITSPSEEKIVEGEKASESPVIKASPPSQGLVAEKEEKEGEKSVEGVLREIVNLKDILGALIVDETGLPIAQQLNIPLDVESTSALISVINKEARESIGRMEIGEFINGIIEMEKGKIFIFDIPPVVLSIFTDKRVMMGLIMVKVKKAIKIIKKDLEI